LNFMQLLGGAGRGLQSAAQAGSRLGEAAHRLGNKAALPRFRLSDDQMTELWAKRRGGALAEEEAKTEQGAAGLARRESGAAVTPEEMERFRELFRMQQQQQMLPQNMMRMESGAAITPEEYERYRMMMPQPGGMIR